MQETTERVVPVNARQSGNSQARMFISTRVRKSPFWHLSERHGCWAYTVYNHMYHPRAYVQLAEGGPLKEYKYLINGVTLWNVAVERQIQIKGPDALAFADLLVTRDLASKCPVNRARYVILCDERGGIINDPVLLRVAEDEIWLSISDSDVLLWAKGVNLNAGYDVRIRELDVAPVQIQGPNSPPLMGKLFGAEVDRVPYYGLWQTALDGLPVVVSRTGFSAEMGYEIYLHDATANADALWQRILDAGEEFDLKVIAPSHVRRIEAGILSYGQDMDIETNPFEVGLDWQVDFDKERFIGKEALQGIHAEGVRRCLVGVRMGGTPITWYNPDFWPVYDGDDGERIGYITSAFYSPRVGSNIGYAMVPASYRQANHPLMVETPMDSAPVRALVVQTPFYDPRKELPKGGSPSVGEERLFPSA
jgi:glycine cleavage system aminomethyltransferase T